MANIAGYNRKLVALLKKHGLADDAQLAPLIEKCSKENLLLATQVVLSGILDELTLLGLVSEECGTPCLDLDKLSVDLDQLKQMNKGNEPLPEDLCKRELVVPIAIIGEFVTLAVANPFDVVLIDNLKLQLQRQILTVVSSERAVGKAIEACFHTQEQKMEQLMKELPQEDDLDLGESEAEKEKSAADDEAAAKENDLESEGENSPAVKAVKHILTTAIKKGASDIHIEPYEKRTRIRLRIDGILHEVMDLPKKLEKALCSRIKIMTDTMNIAERRKPQDGRIALKLPDGKKCDIRVNSLPLVYGEKICMRILAKGNLKDMKEIGFEQQVYDILGRGLGAPQGMVLVTGPTGSGKSTTLYSCLKTVMTPEENVNTVEDPVEYEIEGINQCHVNPKAGMTFASALRALLRQDPDTIMIGEIRDQETIEIAVKAALTGHLVLSTLHTNDAPSTITRIIDMGIDPLMVASTVNAVLAQRLGRRLCKSCKVEMPKEEMPSKEELIKMGFLPEEIDTLKLWKPVGCSLCSKGYKGRYAIVECLEMNNELRRIIIGGGSDLDIRRVALETGMISLRRCALLNAMRGVSTIEEAIGQTIVDEKEKPKTEAKPEPAAA